MDSPKLKVNFNSEKLFIPKLRSSTFNTEPNKTTSGKRKSSFENSPRRKTPRTPRTPQEIESPISSLPGTPRSNSPSSSFSGFKFQLLKRRTTLENSPRRRTPRTPNATPPRTPRGKVLHKVLSTLSQFEEEEEIETVDKLEIDDEQIEEEEEIVKCTDAALIRKYLKICSKVRENLFLGSDMIARDKETLLSNGITHVLNCAKITCDEYFKETIQYKSMALYDGGNQPMIGLFFEAIYFIDEAIKNGGKVYVHCVQGISRSSSFILAYLIWKEKESFKKLYENLKSIRPVSSPNPGFLVQLMKWEEYLKSGGQSVLFRISPLNSYYGRSHFQVGPLLCEKTTTLDSRTWFILVNENSKIFLWKGSKVDEHAFLEEEAKIFTKSLQHGLSINSLEMISESFETEEFQFSLLQLKMKNLSSTRKEENLYLELDYLKNSIEIEKKQPEEIMKPKIKAKLFNYDDDYFDDYGIFEKEDLFSDGIFILLLEELNIIYIWKGSDSEYEDDLMELGKQFLEEKNKTDFYLIKIVKENEETDEFWSYF